MRSLDSDMNGAEPLDGGGFSGDSSLHPDHYSYALDSDPYQDDISAQCLRLNIARVDHSGEPVLTDLAHEFPLDQFEPAPRHREFRASLLHRATATTETTPDSHSVARDIIVHDFLAQALTNLTNWTIHRPIHELRTDAECPRKLEGSAARTEYLASAWAVRSFIRIAAREPSMFNILVQEMGQIEIQLGRFPLGVPMSPYIAYELFNAAVINPLIRPEVIRAFQIIGHTGASAETLFGEFFAALEKQHHAAPRFRADQTT